MPDPTKLSEKNRAKLDGIVQQMISNKESDDNIKFVVDDFKSKYAEKKKPVGTSTSTTPKENTELAPKTGSSVSKSTQGFPEIDTNGILPDFNKMKSGSPVAEKPKTKLQKPPVKEETSFFDYLKENLDTGLATVSKSIYDAPGLVYDAAASITNPIIKGLTGYKGEGASSDKLAKDLGFVNIPSEILKEKIKVSNEKINEYASKNGGDALAALESGNYSGAAKLVAGTTAQSLPIMIAAMASGGESMALTAIGVSTASTKNAQLKDENPEMALGTRVLNSANAGIIEAVTGHLFTGASGAVMKKIIADKGVEAGSKIIGKSFRATIEKSIEKNPLVSAVGEVVEESAVEFGNQVNDMSSGIRAEFDFHAIKNAGLSATGMGGLQTLGVYGAKGYVKAKTYTKLKSNNKEVFKLRNEIENGSLSDANKAILSLRADRLEAENKKLLGTEIEKAKALPTEAKTELNALNNEFEDLKTKFDDIDDADDIPDNLKPAMKEEIKLQATKNQKRKTEILSQNDGLEVNDDFSKFEGVEPDFDLENGKISSLPLKEQERINDLAVEKITGGDKTIEYTKEQASQVANEIYVNEQNPQAEAEKVAEVSTNNSKLDVNQLEVNDNFGDITIGIVDKENQSIKAYEDANGEVIRFATKEEAQAKLAEIQNQSQATPPVEDVVATSVEKPILNKEIDVEDSSNRKGLIPISELEDFIGEDRNGNAAMPNSRETIDKLKEDIAKNGFKEPIVLVYDKFSNDGEASIVEGNHRIIAAKELGLTEIPVRIEKGTLRSDENRIADKMFPLNRKKIGKINDTFGVKGSDLGLTVRQPNEKDYVNEATPPTDNPTNGNVRIEPTNVGESGIAIEESPAKEGVSKPVDGGEGKGDVEVVKKVKSVKGATYDVHFDNDGIISKIISPKDGREIVKFTEREVNDLDAKGRKQKNKDGTIKKKKVLVRNPNYAQIEADALGLPTTNQEKAGKDIDFKVAVDNISETDPYSVALKALVNGAKVSFESIVKETGNKDGKWATNQSDKTLPSIEKLSEQLWEQNQNLDQQEIRNAVIDIISSHSNINSVKESVVEIYNENARKQQEQELHAFLGSLSEKDMAMYQAIQAEDSYIEELSDKEVEEYYNQKLDENEQGQQEFARAEAANQGPENIAKGNEGEVRGEGKQEGQKVGDNQMDGKDFGGKLKSNGITTFKLRDKDKFYHASQTKRNGRLKLSNAPQFGTGVYFSTDKELVEYEFGEGNTTEVSLTIQNPVYTGTKQWYEVEELAVENAIKDHNERKGLTEDDRGYMTGWDISEIPSKFTSDSAKTLGYDAIIDEDSGTYTDEIVVLDESKIVYPEDQVEVSPEKKQGGNNGELANEVNRTKSLVAERVAYEKVTPKNAPKKLPEIIKSIATALKTTLIYGKSKRGGAGSYNPSNALVRISRAGDIDTVAHELGHLLDDRHNILGTIPSSTELAILGQLKWYSERGGSNPPVKATKAQKAEYLQREGLAEFIRSLIANPTQTKIIAPELLAHFENVVDPKTQAILKDFSQDFLDFANATNIEKTLANVEDLKLPNKNKFVEWLKGFRSKDSTLSFTNMDKFYSEMANSNHFGIKAFKALLDMSGKSEVKSHENFEIMSRVFLGINGKLENIFATGLINAKNEKLKAEGGTFKKDVNGRTVYENGTPMTAKWLIEGLDTTSEEALTKEMNLVIAMGVAERTIEYAKKLGRVTDLTGIGGSVDTDLSVAIGALNEFEDLKNSDPKKYNRIKEGVERYRKMADAPLRYAVDKGRISEEQYKLIKDSNEYYIALNRNIELVPGEDLFMAFGGSSNAIGAAKDIIKKSKGGTETIENPYLSLLANINNIIKESDRNEVMSSFVEPLLNMRTMGDGTPIDFSKIGRLANDGDKNTISVYRKGKLEKWQFEENIYKGLKNIESISSDPILSVFAKPSQLIRWTVTHNPVFYARNIVKDTQARMIISNDHSSLKDMIHNASDRELFELYGGSQAGHLHTGKDSYSKAMVTAAKEITAKGGMIINPMNWGKKYVKFLQSGENINRIAEFNNSYKVAIKQGMSEYDAGLYAAFQARDLMDFAVAGHTMRKINQIVVFSNAGVQSIRKANKSLQRDPFGFAYRTALYSVLPTVAIGALRSAMGDDDEYEELSDQQRDMFFNFKTPITGDAWVSIPKPYELGLTSALVDRGVSKLRGNDAALDGFMGTTIKTIMPFDESSFLGGLKPIVETAMNRNTYTGAAIVPEYESGKLLELRKGKSKASLVGQDVSLLFKQANLSIDPRNIDHIMKGYGTYFASQGMAITDLGKKEKTPLNFWIKQSGFAKDVASYNAKSVKKASDLAVEIGKINSKDMKSLRNKIEEFALETDLKKRKALTNVIYADAKEIVKKYSVEKENAILYREKQIELEANLDAVIKKIPSRELRDNPEYIKAKKALKDYNESIKKPSN